VVAKGARNGRKQRREDGMSEAQQKLQEAREAVEAARARLDEVQAMETAARNELVAAHDALKRAREEADTELPGCTIVRGYSWGKTSRVRGVIVDRGDKTIKARPFGESESSVKSYRKNRWGEWAIYPKLISGWQSLEIDGEAGQGENAPETAAGETTA
jgi:hypothetical protein